MDIHCNGQIQTRSGGYFDILSPEVSPIDIIDIAHALSNLCRFTGHTHHFYSVAQHSVLVSRLVPPKFQMAALLHDAAEAYLGDVTSPLKALLPEYKRIERRVEAAILDRFGLPSWLPLEVKHADLVMLATERRDLMPATPEKWAILEGIGPTTERIRYMPPLEAFKLFLHRFRVLQEKEVLRVGVTQPRSHSPKTFA